MPIPTGWRYLFGTHDHIPIIMPLLFRGGVGNHIDYAMSPYYFSNMYLLPMSDFSYLCYLGRPPVRDVNYAALFAFNSEGFGIG